MAALTKKHFEWMAETIARQTAPGSKARDSIRNFAVSLSRQLNPRFDIKRFDKRIAEWDDMFEHKAEREEKHFRGNPYGAMDQREYALFTRKRIPIDEPPEDYTGIAYSVAIIYDGALDSEWLVMELDVARDQAQAVADDSEADKGRLEVVVSEVYVGEDTIEGTGYMTDETFTP